jgi:hypothetical protein
LLAARQRATKIAYVMLVIAAAATRFVDARENRSVPLQPAEETPWTT